jgi:hypothetical protein
VSACLSPGDKGFPTQPAGPVVRSVLPLSDGLLPFLLPDIRVQSASQVAERAMCGRHSPRRSPRACAVVAAGAKDG